MINTRVLMTLIVQLLFFSQAAQSASFDQSMMKTFIQKMVKEEGFDQQALETLFSKAKLIEPILESISRPAEAKEWYQYRPIFIKQSRIDQGVTFWKENKNTLIAAEKKFGVAPEIIVAIIGVETLYGKHKGKYRVIDSLSTLGFNYPKRGKFFRSELKHYLLFTRELGVDPLSLKGSYAGAMGLPQFISSSFRSYAVDFDGDGKINIWDNKKDAIGSVASYFKRHGWQQGKPIVTPAMVIGVKIKPFIDQGLKPVIPLKNMTDAGVRLKRTFDDQAKTSLLAFKQKNDTDHWVAFQNFYTITRYNHSPLYAMAVFQLSEAIKHSMK